MPTADNVLRRKLKRGGVARSPLPETDFIGDTFARQIEEGFRPLVKTVISAMVLECKIMKLSAAQQDLSVPTMLGMLEVEDANVHGLVSIDTDLAFHLIDLMLGGDPAVAPVPITRSFTSIDMALCRLPLEALAQGFAAALGVFFGRPLTKKISITGQRQDVTQMRIAPGYVDVLVYNLALDIGELARSGNLHLFLPLASLDVIRAAMEGEAAKVPDDAPHDLWRMQMRRAAATAPVIVNAVLHRQQMTIAALQALKPGDMFDIPASAPDEVQLLVAQPGGKTAQVAAGRLGAYQGSKVVKLSIPVDPRIRDQVQHIL